MKPLAIIIGAAFLTPTVAWAPAAWGHPGGLDVNGCHHEPKSGTYHCHEGPNKGKRFQSEADMYTGGRTMTKDKSGILRPREERRDDSQKTATERRETREAKLDEGKTQQGKDKDKNQDTKVEEEKKHQKDKNRKQHKRRTKKDDEKKTEQSRKY